MGEHVVPLSFTAGVGNLMRHIAIILGLGARGGFARNSAGGPRGLPWAPLALGIVWWAGRCSSMWERC
jgi:hypothetical protein